MMEEKRVSEADDDRRRSVNREQHLQELIETGALPRDLREKQDVRVAFRLLKPMFECEHCGEQHQSCIMFYDPEGQFVVSSAHVNRVRAAGAGKVLASEGLLELLSEAEAVCQNCYRKRYHTDRRRYSNEQKALLREIAGIKRGRGCSSCDEDDPACLDFHHKDGEEKSFSIYCAVKMVRRDEIMLEVDKCDVQCANCHCKIHWEERELASRDDAQQA